MNYWETQKNLIFTLILKMFMVTQHFTMHQSEGIENAVKCCLIIMQIVILIIKKDGDLEILYKI